MDRLDQQENEMYTQQAYGCSFPFYIDNNLTTRKFFVSKSYPNSPQNKHMLGIPCTGHSDNPLYPFLNTDIPILTQYSQQAHIYNNDPLALRYMRCSRFLEAYQEATCKHIHNDEQKLDALETMTKIAPQIFPIITSQWQVSHAYRDALAMIHDYAQDGNARAQYILASMNASLAKMHAARASELIHEIVDTRSDDECRKLMSTFDIQKLRSICPDEPRIKRIIQEHLYEHGTSQEKQAAFAYFRNEAAYGNLRAACYCAHALLEKNEIDACFEYLQSLMTSDAGRKLLPEFAHLCHDQMIPLIDRDYKQQNSTADIIKGLVLYIQLKYDQAFPLLITVADFQVQPYIFFCLATMFRDGLGVEKSLDNAVSFYTGALSASPDTELKKQIQQILKELADCGNILARCELLLGTVGNGGDYKAFENIVDSFWGLKKQEREIYINYLTKHQLADSSIVQHLLAVLYTLHANYQGDPTKKIDCLKQALNLFEQLSTTDIDAQKHCSSIAYIIGTYFLNNQDYQQADAYFQKALGAGHSDAAFALAVSHIENTDSSQEDFDAGIVQLSNEIETRHTDKPNISVMQFSDKRKVKFAAPESRHNLMIHALEKASPRGDMRVHCLLARLYVNRGTDNYIKLAKKQLARVLKSLTCEQACAMIHSTKAEAALTCIVEQGHVSAYKHLGLIRFNNHDYEKAYLYFDKARKNGDTESCCYCIFMLINGLGTSQSCKQAYHHIQELCQTEQGRRTLPFLCRLSDEPTKKTLSQAVGTEQKYASLLLGIILYHQHGDPEQILAYLQPMTDKNDLYVSYLVAKLLSGHHDEQSSDKTCMLYGQILEQGTADESIRTDCMQELRAMAKSGSGIAQAELIMTHIYQSSSPDDIRACMTLLEDTLYVGRAQCLTYLMSQSTMQRLMNEHTKNNPRASFCLGYINLLMGHESTIDEKIERYKKALEYFEQASKQSLASADDLGNTAYHLANAYFVKDTMDKAIKTYEYAITQGHSKAKSFLQAHNILSNKQSSAEDQAKAIAFFEESANNGEDAPQKILAIFYQNSNKAKSYAYCTSYLSKHPDDPEMRYLFGVLLVLYGGSDGIPTRQEALAYEYLSSTAERFGGPDSIYYWLGRFCFHKGDYTQAIAWFNHATGSTICSLYRLITMLIQADNNAQGYDKDKIYEQLEQVITKFSIKTITSLNKLSHHEVLFSFLKQQADTGNIRAGAILGRLICLLNHVDYNLSKDKAMEYLKQAADAGNAFAQSYLGIIYSNVWDTPNYSKMAFEYFMSALNNKDLPPYIIEEISQELIAMINKPNVGKDILRSAYCAAAALLQHGTPLSTQCAVPLFDKCENYVINNWKTDQSLLTLFTESGIRQIMKDHVNQGDGCIAAYFGVALVIRFSKGIGSFDDVRNEAFPALELALQTNKNVINAQYIARNCYLMCFKIAVAKNLATALELKPLLVRTLELDPDNQDALIELTLIDEQRRMTLEAQQKNSLCFKLALALTEKNKSLKKMRAIFRDIIEGSESLMAGQEDEALHKLLNSGFNAALNNQPDEAISSFQQAGEKFLAPEGYANAALVSFYLKNDVKMAVSLLIKALDLIASKHANVDPGIIYCIQNVLQTLDNRTSTDKFSLQLATILRSKLKQHKVVI